MCKFGSVFIAQEVCIDISSVASNGCSIYA